MSEEDRALALFREAVESGDKEKAAKIRAVIETSESEKPSEDYSARDVIGDVGSELAKGAVGTVDFLSGLIGTNSEARDAMGPEAYLALSPSERANLPSNPAFNKIGKNTAFKNFTERNVPKYGEKMEGLMTGANFAGGALIPMSVLTKAKQAKDLLVGATAFGTGAGAFDALTEDTSDIGKIIAGVGGLTLPVVVKNVVKAGNLFGGASKTEEAAAALYNTAENPEAQEAAARAAVAAGERGTLGQVSGDKWTLGLESGAGAGSDDFAKGLVTSNDEILKGSVNDLTGVAPPHADPQTFLNLAKERVKQTAANVFKRSETKEAALKKAVVKTGVEAETEVAKKENVLLKAVLQQDDKAAKEIKDFNLRTLNEANPSTTPITVVGPEAQVKLGDNFTTEYGKQWDKVDHVPMKSWLGIKDAAVAGKNKLATQVDRDTIVNLLKTVHEVASTPTAAKVKSLDKTLRNAAATAQKDNPTLYRVIKDMRTALRDGLDPEISKRLKEIDGFYGKFLTTRRATANSKNNPDVSVTPSNRGVYTAEQLDNAGKFVSGESRYAKNEGFLDGSIAPQIGRNTNNKETTTALIDAGEASIKQTETEAAKKIAETEARAKALRGDKLKRTEQVKSGPVGQFASHDEAVNAVNKVFANTTDPINQTKSLIQTAKKDKTGKAVSSLKAAYIQSLAGKVTKGGAMTTSAADKFKSLKGPLGELFDPAEMKRLEAAIKESHKLKMHRASATTKMPQISKGMKFYMASIFGIKAATAILSGNSLLMGRVGREAAVGKFVGEPHKKMLKKMEEMMLDPAKYIDGIDSIRANSSQANIRKNLATWGVIPAAVASEHEQRNK